MHARIRTEADLDTALAALVRADVRFEQALAASGRPPLRKRPDGFAGLAAIVVAQQLSTASASAILERLKAALDPLDHDAVLRARPAKLARIGLSAPKIRTLKAIARAVSKGTIDLPSLVDMSAEDAHRALTALHGIHVLGGLFVWARATARAVRGIDLGKVRLSVELCTVYWHYLLLVWAALFFVLLNTHR